MDDNRNLDELTGDEWLASFLAAKEAEKERQDSEIGADEEAVFVAGLTHPDDLELERILEEVHAEEKAEADTSGQPEEDDVKEYDPTEVPVIPTEEFKDEEFRDTFGEGEDLEHAFSDEEIPEIEEVLTEEPQEEQIVEKRRPKKRREYWFWGLPQLASSFIWLAIIVTIGLTVGRIGWMCAADVLALNRKPITATVTIAPGDDMKAVSEKLKEAGLISYPGLFELYADITDAQEKIVPGEYTFVAKSDSGESMLYDYMALVTVMSPHQSTAAVVEDLRIPEGATCQQIFQLLEDNKVCTVKDMEHFLTVQMVQAEEGKKLTEAQKKNNALVKQREKLFRKYSFLKNETLEGKYALEGYLFPNTYDFYENDEPARVLEKMLNAFKAAITVKMENDLKQLNLFLYDTMRANGFDEEYIIAHQLTMRDIVIIASMIEKEASGTIESFTISSVIYNRMAHAKDEYKYLNIDSPLRYAMGEKKIEDTDRENFDSPYNTYLYPGLPPTPICNPSQNSLAAALDPEETIQLDEFGDAILDSSGNTKRIYYYFFALNPETQKHEFFQTEKAYKEFVASLKVTQ